VCVWERERGKESNNMCVCVFERERAALGVKGRSKTGMRYLLSYLWSKLGQKNRIFTPSYEESVYLHFVTRKCFFFQCWISRANSKFFSFYLMNYDMRRIVRKLINLFHGKYSFCKFDRHLITFLTKITISGKFQFKYS